MSKALAGRFSGLAGVWYSGCAGAVLAIELGIVSKIRLPVLSMQILVNGEPKVLSGPLSVTELLDQLGLRGQRVAVEVNREIVPRSRHGEHELNNDDRVEVVRAIGGG